MGMNQIQKKLNVPTENIKPRLEAVLFARDIEKRSENGIAFGLTREAVSWKEKESRLSKSSCNTWILDPIYTEIDSMVRACGAFHLPVYFVLGRRVLARLLHVRGIVTAVGIVSAEGARAQMRSLKECHAAITADPQ